MIDAGDLWQVVVSAILMFAGLMKIIGIRSLIPFRWDDPRIDVLMDERDAARDVCNQSLRKLAGFTNRLTVEILNPATPETKALAKELFILAQSK